MHFTKMQGAGNDYVYVNCFEETLPDSPEVLARQVSDRNFGIGGDGLILIEPSELADARMRMFNADGSESEMCGNGIRCVAKYVHDHGISQKPRITIETGAGILTLDLFLYPETCQRAGLVERVRVDMGLPILESSKIPTKLPGDPPIEVPLKIGGKEYLVTAVSMGNPHCILFIDEPLTDELVWEVGPEIEIHPMFPNRVNVEFVHIRNPHEVTLRVWERGSGETMACGTGACAVCVAGALTNKTKRAIKAHLPGGVLELEWRDNDHVFMTGPAVEVFSGEWVPRAAPIPDLEETS
ncbi:Diaminopimelate epimerase [Planctomycetales bacterium 10988]|nr:Diaminopimelate epimerase [Planctomycetales bacterium 10988]